MIGLKLNLTMKPISRTKVFSVFFLFFQLFLIIVLRTTKKSQLSYAFFNITTQQNHDCGIYGCIDDYLDFEGFDNVNGVNKTIVPDIVHLLYLQETELKFYQVINIFSIYYNHKPGLIYIHCDNCSFHGKYWEWVKGEPGLYKLIKIHSIPFHDTISSL